MRSAMADWRSLLIRQKASIGLDDFVYTVGGRVVQQTDDWSLLGSCFVVGLKSLLTWNGFDLQLKTLPWRQNCCLKSSVFREVSLVEEFSNLLCFLLEVCVVRTQAEKSQELRRREAVFRARVVLWTVLQARARIGCFVVCFPCFRELSMS